MSLDTPHEVPAWVRSFFADRPQSELRAWWKAVCKLYGPDGVRMDFQSVTREAAAPRRLAAG